MTTLTLELQDISNQEIDEFNQNSSVSINDMLASYVRNLLKKTQQDKVTNLTILDQYSPDEIVQAKATLESQFGEFNHLVTKVFTVEEMNQGIADYFVKEWKNA